MRLVLRNFEREKRRIAVFSHLETIFGLFRIVFDPKWVLRGFLEMILPIPRSFNLSDSRKRKGSGLGGENGGDMVWRWIQQAEGRGKGSREGNWVRGSRVWMNRQGGGRDRWGQADNFVLG